MMTVMSNVKRVLLLDHQLFRGGGEIVVELLAIELKSIDYDVAICGTAGSDLESFCKLNKIVFFEMEMESAFINHKFTDGIKKIGLLNLLRSVNSLQRIYMAFKPDVVHVHTLKCGILFLPTIIRTRLRNSFSSTYIYHDHTLTKSLFHRLLIIAFDYIICVSESVCVKYDNRNNKEKIKVIPNGVSDKLCNLKMLDIYSCYNIDSNIPILAFAGRIVPSKGVHLLIQAVCELLNQGIQFHTIIMGFNAKSSDIYYESTLHELVSINDLKRHITFVDFLPYDQSLQILAGAHVVVIPSIEPESFGMSALEALILGCVVVGTESGGLSDILHKWGGILVTPGNKESLTIGICQALNIVSLGNYQERIFLGKSIYKAYSAKNFISEVAKIYNTRVWEGEFN